MAGASQRWRRARPTSRKSSLAPEQQPALSGAQVLGEAEHEGVLVALSWLQGEAGLALRHPRQREHRAALLQGVVSGHARDRTPLEALDPHTEVVGALLHVLHPACVPICVDCLGREQRESRLRSSLHLADHVLDPRPQDGGREARLEVRYDALHVAAPGVHLEGLPQPPHRRALVALPEVADAQPGEAAEVPRLQVEDTAAILDGLIEAL
eukprot:CAMPEP_0113831192 /NCGR_PEP_ID=MMETSP0328-20130328/6727_1 /TAXON_ID=39455 /ORGANISM="Alexandrium minutum" /LENGTH=210 /DNA_ID=CAMNT_0000799347 /DNA_START=137 /DNA_END=765 /DNA_ORIENTATION=+ /assembly_acc=CAM_ASM_000350